MSDVVTLTLRVPLEREVEADVVTPDRLATLGAREIAALPLWEGARRLVLGDLFEIRGERAARVRVVGDCARVIALGAGMTAGELVVDGSAGRYVGTRMAGGVLHVTGSAGDGAGLEMVGGVLRVDGDAGDRVGAARLGASKGMLGGEIIVRGAVGAEAGARMRRGLVVCGRAGARAGEGMIAGSVVALGPIGDDPGRYNKRGSIVALGGAPVPLGYAYDCTYHPPHVALTLRMLRARFGVVVDADSDSAPYRRYSGDLAELGRGELLIREGA
ncbi:MAG TPA: formylmethanofuran dehydrogenase subunit C [Gemmatimonadaceae bacterium]